MYDFISRVFADTLVIGFLCCLVLATLFLILMVIGEIKWPDTQYHGSRNAFGLYWHTKPNKRNEEEKKQDWVNSRLFSLGKIVIIGFILYDFYCIFLNTSPFGILS